MKNTPYGIKYKTAEKFSLCCKKLLIAKDEHKALLARASLVGVRQTNNAGNPNFSAYSSTFLWVLFSRMLNVRRAGGIGFSNTVGGHRATAGWGGIYSLFVRELVYTKTMWKENLIDCPLLNQHMWPFGSAPPPITTQGGDGRAADDTHDIGIALSTHASLHHRPVILDTAGVSRGKRASAATKRKGGRQRKQKAIVPRLHRNLLGVGRPPSHSAT